MIDFKNYERLTIRDWKIEYEIGVCRQDVSAGECPVYNDCFKYIQRLAELEDMIEQVKLVEKIEPKTAMTKEQQIQEMANIIAKACPDLVEVQEFIALIVLQKKSTMQVVARKKKSKSKEYGCQTQKV